MLAKPTQEVAHGGGLRFEIGSNYYKTIFNWIAQGVPFGDPANDLECDDGSSTIRCTRCYVSRIVSSIWSRSSRSADNAVYRITGAFR
jgi:hypothetical protein